MNRAEATQLLTPTELLDWLRRRGGQEFAVRLRPAVSAAKRQRGRAAPESASEFPLYRLSARGDKVQALGPAGQARQLSETAFLELFSSYRFAAPTPTGVMHDLGPLFS